MGPTKITAKARISEEVARKALHHFGDTNLGAEPTRFETRLFYLLGAADSATRDLLAEHWPEHVYAFEVITRTLWGLDWLRDTVKIVEVAS